MPAKAPTAKRSEKSDGKGDGDVNNSNLVPRVFYLTPRERRKKDPGSGWSRVLVTNLSSWRGPILSKYCRRCCLLPPEPALWVTMENSLSISQRRFVISSTLLSTFETKLGLETVKR